MVVPVSGWATERFGDKPVWIGSLLLFTVGSALSGQARDFGSLVAFRALQGAAAGLITPVVQTMLVRAAGREKLGRYRPRAGSRARRSGGRMPRSCLQQVIDPGVQRSCGGARVSVREGLRVRGPGSNAGSGHPSPLMGRGPPDSAPWT